MGGDRAPAEPVKGAVLAAKELKIEVALVGPQQVLQAELKKHPLVEGISIVPAGDTIAMEADDVARVVRQRPDAAINVAMGMVKDGRAQAVVSAGHTGAVMASAFFVLGRIPGIERPAIGILVPYAAGKVFFLDAGANPDCKPSYLVQFGQMGSAYMEKVIGIPQPRVGLLNIGEESNKGNELAQEAHARLAESGLNFIGNVEGVHVHKGVADVLVTDGFTGNVALKVGEGIADYILQQVRGVVKSSPLFIAASVLLKPALRRALKDLRYEEYGGANLMGIDGVVVIAHGRSDALAIKNGLWVANSAAQSGLIETMRQSFSRRSAAPETTPAAGR
ncbi:MAG: phosphate acyltransferase PlsX [Dehalococcoidia bacterium]|nr:phosphate acyltransferase PlsX [Dehalococcoidia bacterium]